MSNSEEYIHDFICNDCLCEPYVEDLIHEEGERGICTFCSCENKRITIERLADLVDKVMQTFYRPTASGPEGYELALQRNKESSYEWEREGYTFVEVIDELLGAKEEVAEKLKEVLQDLYYDFELAKLGEENFYDDEVLYEELLPNQENFFREWTNFENNIKKKSRYFGYENFLDKILKDINNFDIESKSPIIKVIGTNKKIKSIFRARVLHPEKLEQALKNLEVELSPPPISQSRPGRMNPHGIATFYGALDYRTAISEVRPPMNSKVVVGKFDLTTELRILDLNSLSKIEIDGSLFDPTYRAKIELTRFLSSLGARMSKTVLPDDELLEYLPTQIISDYLAWNQDIGLHGIIYPSVYSSNKGKNIVIFSKAAVTDKRDIQRRINIDVSLGYEDEDGFCEDIRIREKFPSECLSEKEARDSIEWNYLGEHEDNETSEVTLKLDKKALKVYHINGVRLQYSEAEVKYEAGLATSYDRLPTDF